MSTFLIIIYKNSLFLMKTSESKQVFGGHFENMLITTQLKWSLNESLQANTPLWNFKTFKLATQKSKCVKLLNFGGHFGFMQIRRLSPIRIFWDFQYVVLGTSKKCIPVEKILLQFVPSLANFEAKMTGLVVGQLFTFM